MFNILLDELPEERNGYRLNTDFRVGIQIAQASEDVNLTEYEKLQIFASLLFYEECPPDAEGK